MFYLKDPPPKDVRGTDAYQVCISPFLLVLVGVFPPWIFFLWRPEEGVGCTDGTPSPFTSLLVVAHED